MEEHDNSFERAETRFKIETSDAQQMKLYLNANRMACALYDLLCWRRNIYNGKNYGEGSVLYKGKLYSKNEWSSTTKPEEDYDENHFLKDKTTYLYTEEELERKLDEYLNEIRDFIYDYME